MVQLWNALAPIEETLLGIWISISPLQLVNALSLINVDPSDNVILRFSQSEKKSIIQKISGHGDGKVCIVPESLAAY